MPDKKSELLMPAGSLEKLKVAILYGADAVYMGTPDLSLRTRSTLSLNEVIEGVTFAHAHNKRVYLTLNIFSHNRDIEKLPLYVETIRRVKPDGVLIADPGVFAFVKEHAPELPLHISTQANVCSYLSVQFWQSLGAKLVVLAREVSFKELAEIREKCPAIKLEAFVHGAMCMTYSGRCMLSNFMAERGANQGNCANSCRWSYKLRLRLKDGSLKDLPITDETRDLFDFLLEEELRPGDLLPIEEDERGSYVLNAKDLCLMPRLNDYLSIGVDSLKVEGRNRSAYYVAVTARAYRRAIDAWREDPESWDPTPYMRELETIPNRGYTLAFHDGALTHHAQDYVDTRTLSMMEYAGIITQTTEDAFFLDVKNRLESGDALEFIPHNASAPVIVRLKEFEDVAHRRTVADAINAGQKPLLRIPFLLFPEETRATLKQNFPPYTIVRKHRALTKEQFARLQMDRAATTVELKTADESDYQKTKETFLAAQAAPQTTTAHLGAEGCCGRGCNGCLHFLNNPLYEKARALLKTKPPGTRLTPEEAKTCRAESSP